MQLWPIGALSEDRRVIRQNAAACTNGRFDGPHRSIRDGCWMAGQGRSRRVNETSLSVELGSFMCVMLAPASGLLRTKDLPGYRPKPC